MSERSNNGLSETAYLLKSPANAKHLERAIAQYKQGKVLERGLIDNQNCGLDRPEALP